MKSKPLKMGIIGCGDFLRLQTPGILRSKDVSVSAVFDPDAARARKHAQELKVPVADSAESLIADVEIVAIFVPPWARKPLLVAAAKAKKHIITTKPLASTIPDCDEMLEAVKAAGTLCGVIYNRTETPAIEALKNLFVSGRYGQLALFKQDWIHHYPSWNNWALDPSRNGGPFMDAMIHNMNIVRYLMGRPVVQGTLFSDRHAHPDLSCADTEFMKLDFTENGSAHLFITWAADLAVYDNSGNHREHIDIWYAITSQGWRITQEEREGKGMLVASRDGKQELIPIPALEETPYDRLTRAIRENTPLDGILPTLEEARGDILIVRKTGETPGRLVHLDNAF